jgi:hypothetical protein
LHFLNSEEDIAIPGVIPFWYIRASMPQLVEGDIIMVKFLSSNLCGSDGGLLPAFCFGELHSWFCEPTDSKMIGSLHISRLGGVNYFITIACPMLWFCNPQISNDW